MTPTALRPAAILLFLAIFASLPRAQAGTLDEVRARGFVHCGVSQGLPGFSNPDAQGRWTGFDTDICRAVAAAIFGDASQVKFTPLSATERFTSLQSGEIDLLTRNTTWTMSRDTRLGLSFAAISYYDGQGFLTGAKSGVKRAVDLEGRRICSISGTTTQRNLREYMADAGREYQAVLFERYDQMRTGYLRGGCDVMTGDASALAAQRALMPKPADHLLLDEVISKEPLGPVVRQGDEEWLRIVRWTIYALINAEELNITAENLEAKKSGARPVVRRLLGGQENLGEGLRLPREWAARVIRNVGNYETIYDRNLGPSTQLNIKRGLNRLWNKGGILYAPPIK